MNCPNCSNEITDDSLFCSMCGSDLSKINETSIVNNKDNKNNQISKFGFNKYGIALGIIACILFFISASQISSAANEMVLLRSESGTSLAEVYYQDVGKALQGFAMFARALGISILAISFKFHSKQYRSN